MIETWLIYSLVAAVLTSITSVIEKKTLLKEHAMEFCVVVSIFNLLIVLPLFFFIDYSGLKIFPIILIFFSTVLASVGFLFIAKSIRHMKISESVPLFSLTPGLTAILAFIFLKEVLNFNQILGIGFLVAGAYILETKSSLNIFDPVKKFRNSKYIHYIFIAILFYSVGALIDRFVLFNYDMQVEAFVAFAHVFLAIHFIFMIYFFHDGFKGIKHGMSNAGRWIFFVSVLIVGYRVAQVEAIKIANVALVVSIKRMSVLFTVFLGNSFFHEGKLFRKIIATLIMVIGAVLLVF